MTESVHVFASWESFYVIIGSSAAALTGLNFVVIALSAEAHTPTPTEDAIKAFSTPTVVHFGVVLFLSALLTAPWPSITPADIGFYGAALFGVAYVLMIMRQAFRQKDYKPVLEDWVWHFGIPLIAYLVLLIAAITMLDHTTTALFLVAASSLVLLYTGIHNAWDSVTWMVASRQRRKTKT
jgi:hypothetical protein